MESPWLASSTGSPSSPPWSEASLPNESKVLTDWPNQSLLACWLFSLACLALLCSSSLHKDGQDDEDHQDNPDYTDVPLASPVTASGMEQEKPRPYQAELGVLGSPMGLWCMALVASSLFCS